MRLVNFSVTNFRSITSAHKIPLTDATIIIGKNNQGKSNILKALNIAMNALKEHAGTLPRSGSMAFGQNDKILSENCYDWNRDFPVSLQNRKLNLESIFELKFDLTDEEITTFKHETGSNINGELSLRLSIGRKKTEIRVFKKGAPFSDKSNKIAKFIGKLLDFNYIPAIRTEEDTLRIVRDMLTRELETLEKNTDYITALNTIREIQEPVLRELAKTIEEPLQQFIPTIANVKISIPEDTTKMALRQDFEVLIDDDTETKLEYKGDGVKSLAALALLKDRTVRAKASIIAIEEPESHLHPGAIRHLRNLILESAGENQILISTHNPLFVNRTNIASNIIINKGKASPAKLVKNIREVLGIQASDNLVNANVVLLVEGETDVDSVRALLKEHNPILKKALNNNVLIIEPLRGAGNLSYQLALFNNVLCETYALLDNDAPGRDVSEKAKADGQLKSGNLTLTNCQGMTDSEFEDWINTDIYKAKIQAEFNVDIDDANFKNRRGKWSNRMKNLFLSQGKPWNKDEETAVKVLLAKCVKETPKEALAEHDRGPIDALMTALEKSVIN